MSRPEQKSRPLRLVALLMALCLAWAVSAVVLGLVQRVAARLRRPRLQCRGPGIFTYLYEDLYYSDGFMYSLSKVMLAKDITLNAACCNDLVCLYASKFCKEN